MEKTAGPGLLGKGVYGRGEWRVWEAEKGPLLWRRPARFLRPQVLYGGRFYS